MSSYNGGLPPHPPPSHHAPAPPPLVTPSPKTDTMVYVKKELLELGQELGQGEFGSVLMGVYHAPEGRVSIACTYIHTPVSPIFCGIIFKFRIANF